MQYVNARPDPDGVTQNRGLSPIVPRWHVSTKASVWVDGKLWPYVSLKYSGDVQRTPSESDDDQWQWGLGLDVLQGSGWMGGLGYARVVGRQGIDDQSLTFTLRKSY